ncbi:hypothetical protein [Limosilactobacillus reuteri]|uniref:hypothetical protein n=1 Tax=Limosilactobacillus reuteri TaxID=1598 RepID=UPI001CDD5D34|nr:hypothetical protein [Limosilactobacillus reuteri]MCH5384216.1 hypothetical protein [Limosilactobacillus reuteri]
MRVWAKVIKTDITTFSSINIAHAVFGFRQMGAEIVEYENLDQIYDQVTKDDLVLDYVFQSQEIFHKFGVPRTCPIIHRCWSHTWGAKSGRIQLTTSAPTGAPGGTSSSR